MRSVTKLMVICGLLVTGIATYSVAQSAVTGEGAALASAGVAHHQAASPGRGAGGSVAGGSAAGGSVAGGGGMKAVRFGGYVIDVPAGWPVYRLGRDPSRCVRFDQHAVYLGHPGAEQQCPAHLAGRVATISLETPSGAMRPAGGNWRLVSPHPSGQTGGPGIVAGPLRAGATVWVAPDSGQVMAVFQRGLSVLELSATYGNDAALAGQILRSVRAGPGTSAVAPSAAAPARAAAWRAVHARMTGAVKQAQSRRHHRAQRRHHRAQRRHHRAQRRHHRAQRRHHRAQRRHHRAQRRHHRGHRRHRARMGFDTCAAPSLRVMRKWRPAFSAVAVYIGGPEAACGWGNLSRRWVRAATRMGWRLIPTYVGRQAPCTRFSVRIRHGRAEREGRAAARAAVRLAHALGIGRHAPIYDDMEAYRHHRPHCRRPVLAFLDGWTRSLHRHHYRSGVYSSAGSAAQDLGRHRRVYGRRIAKPNSVWFGLWDLHPDLNGVPYVRNSWWRGGHRIKQFRGPHRRRINGARLDIDTDLVAGAVYRLTAPGRLAFPAASLPTVGIPLS